VKNAYVNINIEINKFPYITKRERENVITII